MQLLLDLIAFSTARQSFCLIGRLVKTEVSQGFVTNLFVVQIVFRISVYTYISLFTLPSK